MKKLISLSLCLLMLLCAFVGCTDETEESGSDLENAKAYIVNMYQTGNKDEAMVMLMDKDVLSVVAIDGVSYQIQWSVKVTEGEADSVKVVSSETANHVKIDIPDLPDEDIYFTATATIKDEKGQVTASFKYVVEGLNISSGPSAEEIINMAYALEEGASLDQAYTLTGVVTSIDTEYSEQYKNITVTMVVENFNDKPIKCYRLTGNDVQKIAVGDTITVTGMLTNYKGTIEYDAGATLNKLVSAGGESSGDESGDESNVSGDESDVSGDESDTETSDDPTDTPTTDKTQKEIVDEAYELEEDEKLPYIATLTGKVTVIDNAYDEEFGNITVTIVVDGRDKKPIKCYRLTGDDVDRIAKGDTITVTGTIKNYFGEIEFDFGCKLENRIAGGGTPTTQLTDPAQIMDFAYALEENGTMEYDVTLTGVVTMVTTPYDPGYKNISVIIDVEGSDKELLLYRMKGTDVELLVKGDTITVTGRIINYNGTVEMGAGCTMRKRVSGGGTVVTAPSDPKEIVKAAFELAPGEALPYRATLTGKIIEIDTPYSEQYGNITVIIEIEGCEDQPIKCFRMKGEGAAALKVGDVITVSGTIKNYQHSSGDCEVEFDSGCTFVK